VSVLPRIDYHHSIFLFREDTTIEKAKEILIKFCARSAVLATDGFIVYDIQDEKGRTETERPFPFRKTMDASWLGSTLIALRTLNFF
jgi:hypothetical protein